MSVQKLLAGVVAVLLLASPLVLLTSHAPEAQAQTYNVINDMTITTTDLNPFVDGSDLNAFFDFLAGVSIAAVSIQGCLNGECGRDVGAVPILGQDADCKTGNGTYCRALAYCVEADVNLNILGSPFGPYTFDAKATYLAWKYDGDYHGGFQASGGGAITAILTNVNGNTAPAYAAAQALIWKWVSDPNTDSDVWDGFNTSESVSDAATGFTVDGNTNPDPSVDSWLVSNDNLGGPYLYHNDAPALMAAANQAILDLEAEAIAKQGPWSVANSADYSGIVITGPGGPIYGEQVLFDTATSAVTDANGYVAWPDGATELGFQRPGTSYLGVGNNNSQNTMVVFGEHVSVTRPEVEVIPDPTPTPAPTPTPTPEPTPEPIALTDEDPTPEDELPFVGSERTPMQVAVVLVLMGLGITVTVAVIRR